MIRQVRLFLPALVVAFTACRAPTSVKPPTEIPSGAVDVAWSGTGAVRIAHAYYSGFRQPARSVIDNDADWRAAWAAYTANQGSPPPAPAIDFAHYDVLIAALGERNSGGYDMNITRIAVASDLLWVQLVSTRPGPRCGTTAALTQPVDIVRIPRPHPGVMFVEKSAETSC